MIGGKMGAAVGMALGPVGAAIGGIAGAIGGVILGRLFTNRVKMANYKKAIVYLNQNLDSIAGNLPAVIDNKMDTLKKKSNRIPQRMGISFFSGLWPNKNWLLAKELTKRMQKAIYKLQSTKDEFLRKRQQPSNENEISPAGIMAINYLPKVVIITPA